MKGSIAFVFTASAALLSAQSTASDSDSDSLLPSDAESAAAQHLDEICLPSNSSGMPDMNAPCNAVQAIYFGCLYGPSYLTTALSAMRASDVRSAMKKRQSSNDDDESSLFPMQKPETQRTCFCESQFWDQTLGCEACFAKHGGLDADIVDAKQMSTLSSSYCAVTAKPSVGLGEYLLSYSKEAQTTSVPSSFSDPIGNKTDVSLYYTPSVTGSAAWFVAEATGGSSGMASFSTTKTSKGQIVATATGNVKSGDGDKDSSDNNNKDSKASGSAGSSGSSTTNAPNSAQTPFVAAAAGLIGVAGLVAML